MSFISNFPFQDPRHTRYFDTECARDRDLYKLVSCGKFVNDILLNTIFKTHYLTLGHHAQAEILCSCLNFFWAINSLIVLTKTKKPKKLGVQYFCLWKRSLAHPVAIFFIKGHSDNLIILSANQGKITNHTLHFLFQRAWETCG